VIAIKRLIRFMWGTDGSLQHKAVRSGAWVGASSVGVSFLTFFRGIILARLLTPEIFGQMAIGLMAVRLLDIFTETGFGAALIHRQGRFEEARDTAFTLMVLRGVGLAALSLVVAPFFAWFYGQPSLTPIISVIGLTFLLTGVRNPNVIALQKELDFRRLTYLEQAGAFLSFAATVGLAFWLRNIWALVLAQLAGAAISSALSFLFIPGGVRFRLNAEVARELYRYGRYITGLVIVLFLTSELDNAVIGKLLGMQSLGYYTVAYTLANIPATYLSKLVAKVLFPLFSKLQSEPAALREEYARGLKLIAATVIPMAVFLMVLAPEIVGALYTTRWLPAVAPLQILAVFGACRALWMLNGYLYNAIGKPQVDFLAGLCRLATMSALLLPLTTRYGTVGAALAVTLPMGAQFCAGTFLSRRLIGAPLALTLRPVVVAGAQGIVIAAVLWVGRAWIPLHSWSELVTLLALGVVVLGLLNARDLKGPLARVLRARVTPVDPQRVS
jgi:O-antigen/teichoic acid export membrane protein